MLSEAVDDQDGDSKSEDEVSDEDEFFDATSTLVRLICVIILLLFNSQEADEYGY